MLFINRFCEILVCFFTDRLFLTRTQFLKELIFKTKDLDDTCLLSAALQVHNNDGVFVIDDPLGEFTDIVSVNQYLGWYKGLPDDAQKTEWEVKHDKSLFLVKPVQVQKVTSTPTKGHAGVKNFRFGFMKNK